MTMTSVRVQAKGQVTIPKGIREKLNVQPGDLMVFVETDEGVMVKPAAVMTDRIYARKSQPYSARSVSASLIIRLKKSMFWLMKPCEKPGSNLFDASCP